MGKYYKKTKKNCNIIQQLQPHRLTTMTDFQHMIIGVTLFLCSLGNPLNDNAWFKLYSGLELASEAIVGAKHLARHRTACTSLSLLTAGGTAPSKGVLADSEPTLEEIRGTQSAQHLAGPRHTPAATTPPEHQLIHLPPVTGYKQHTTGSHRWCLHLGKQGTVLWHTYYDMCTIFTTHVTCSWSQFWELIHLTAWWKTPCHCSLTLSCIAQYWTVQTLSGDPAACWETANILPSLTGYWRAYLVTKMELRPGNF